MLEAFACAAARSPSRQRSLRKAVVIHVACIAALAAAVKYQFLPWVLFGHLLVVAGIVEGAMLVGWRLSQLPKSQALEFLLAAPVRPATVFFAEAGVGLTRLALVGLSGLPILVWLMTTGDLYILDVVVALGVPIVWGAVSGLGIAAWAYEPRWLRIWLERLMLGMVVVYLGIGIVVAERLRDWLDELPDGAARGLLDGFTAIHRFNPFAVMELWFRDGPASAMNRLVAVQLAGMGLLIALVLRAGFRLQAHFHDQHYRPAADLSRGRRRIIGDWPLSWWAVRRVREFSGRINVWLAAGFGIGYAAFILAGPNWPPWMGRAVFEFFDRIGGVAVLATALVLLAAVPAAFQYGLWDSNAHDRCRRLELLLLTQLTARDYWRAAGAAAGRRGAGYFAVAALLWFAAAFAGAITAPQALAALASGLVLWSLYFTLGFRAFASGRQANGLGTALTLGLPALTIACFRFGFPPLACMLPPGSVYAPAAALGPATWLLGPLVGGMLLLTIAPLARGECDANLRRWYRQHHGRAESE
jgi:hypothetical protein